MLARTTYQREAENLRQHVAQLANDLNSLVERELDKRAVMAGMLAASPELRSSDLAAFYDEAVVGTRGTQSWAILVDAKSQRLNTLRPLSAASVPLASGMPILRAGVTVFFTMAGPVRHVPIACVQVPEARKMPPAFNVGVCFDPQIIQEIFNATTFPRDSFGGVVESNGLVVARSKVGHFSIGADTQCRPRQATCTLTRRSGPGSWVRRPRKRGVDPATTSNTPASEKIGFKLTTPDCS